MVGGVAVADQHTGKLIAQDFIHHRLAPTPSQEVPLGGCAEGDWSKIAHVAVVAIFTPTGLVGMDHRTASDAFYYGGQFRCAVAVQQRWHCGQVRAM